jgi:cell shape-determining protein MreC
MTKVTNEYPYTRLKTGGQYYDTTPKPETIKKRLDAVEDIYETAKAEINELRSENEKLKKLLKESFESFPTKRLADRIYSIDGIERPEPEPIPMKPGEETSF